MATAALWEMLARPLDPWRAAEAVLGISFSAARMMTSALHVTSPEAEDLLDAMPHLVRSLAISSAVGLELCQGDVRGPIQWSETMSARANSAGDPNVFVCASPMRAYDTPENRVLVAALLSISNAARQVDVGSLRSRDTPLARRIRDNGNMARRYLDHRALTNVPRVRPSARDRKRTRSGNRRRQYAPAMAVLDVVTEPLTADELELVADERTAAEHAVAVMAIAELRLRGYDIPAARIRDHAVVAGPLTYVHRSTRLAEIEAGVRVNGDLLDVSEPEEVPAALDRLGV